MARFGATSVSSGRNRHAIDFSNARSKRSWIEWGYSLGWRGEPKREEFARSSPYTRNVCPGAGLKPWATRRAHRRIVVVPASSRTTIAIGQRLHSSWFRGSAEAERACSPIMPSKADQELVFVDNR